MAAAVQAGRMTDSPGGEDQGGGPAGHDYAGEVRVDGVAGCGGRAGVGDLLTGVFEAGDGGGGEGADDLLGWRPGRGGPAVEDGLGQRDALVDDELAGVGALVEVDAHQAGTGWATGSGYSSGLPAYGHE